jgi:hypothetical protein
MGSKLCYMGLLGGQGAGPSIGEAGPGELVMEGSGLSGGIRMLGVIRPAHQQFLMGKR